MALLAKSSDVQDELVERLRTALEDGGDLFAAAVENAADEVLPSSRLAAMHEEWAGDVSQLLEEVGFASLKMPARVDVRSARLEQVDHLLAEVQSERGPAGEPRYEVYK